MENGFKVGQLAKLTGLSVRTLHYYEQLGLLSPAQRGSNGYRQYGEADVSRLQQIATLKALGFPLSQIKRYLGNPKYSLLNIIPMQIKQLRENIHQQDELIKKLEGVESYLKVKHKIPVEQLLTVMNQMQNIPPVDFNDEEMAIIKKQGEKLGQEHIRAVEAEWPELIKKVQQHVADDTDPKNPEVIKLARRWMELGKEFTAGHPGIEKKIGDMYREHGSKINFGNPNGANMLECMQYIQKALS